MDSHSMDSIPRDNDDDGEDAAADEPSEIRIQHFPKQERNYEFRREGYSNLISQQERSRSHHPSVPSAELFFSFEHFYSLSLGLALFPLFEKGVEGCGSGEEVGGSDREEVGNLLWVSIHIP